MEGREGGEGLGVLYGGEGGGFFFLFLLSERSTCLRKLLSLQAT